MLDFRNTQRGIANALSDYAGVPVVLANQTAQMPSYPYISFSVTTMMSANNGTYGRYILDADSEQIVYGKQITQTWSFTVQSDDQTEAAQVALAAHDYFSIVGRDELSNHGIAVRTVGAISSRDSLITVEYEYRNGFDVTFAIMDIVNSNEMNETFIETVEINNEME